MTTKTTMTSVNKDTYEIWSDFIKRGTFACNTKTGEVKQISFGCYIQRDLTVRKAIARAFSLATFKK